MTTYTRQKLPESLCGRLDGLVHVCLVSLLDLDDGLARGGVQGGEGLARHAGVPLVVDEDPGVLHSHSHRLQQRDEESQSSVTSTSGAVMGCGRAAADMQRGAWLTLFTSSFAQARPWWGCSRNISEISK